MSAKPKPKIDRIKVGSVSLPFYEWTDPRSGKIYHRWTWKDSDGKWRYGTRAKKEDAIEAARAQARTIANGKLDLEAITATQSDLVRQFLALDPTADDLQRLRQWRSAHRITLADLANQWHAGKLAELHGKESAHLKHVRLWLAKLAKALPGSAIEIRADQLQQFIEAHSSNPKSRSENRSRLVTLWDYARTHELFDSQEANKLPAYRQDKDKSVVLWTPEQIRLLIQSVPSEFLPWVALSAFSGLRSEEISPAPHTKPPLDWKAIRRDAGGNFDHIELSAAQSKVGKRRLIPITPTLAAWLTHLDIPDSGIICPRYPSKHATTDLGKAVGGWKKNALRHSYGSYRAAVTKNLPALALEMGNSVAMIEKHYREAVREDQALQFWGLTPSEVFRKRSKKRP